MICQNGLFKFLTNKLAAIDPTNAHVRLFSNNYVPAIGDTVANYTEASYSGYAAQSIGLIPGLTWDSVNSRYLAIWSALSFVGTGGSPQNVYGYYVTAADGTLLWAETITGGPVSMGPTTTTLVVQPTLSEANG